MAQAFIIEPDDATRALSARRCLVSGEVRPKEELVRFVLDPAGSVVPDIEGTLPGRGLWVLARADSIETAAHKNLFAKAARAKARVTDELVPLVEKLLRKRCLSLLGLAQSAGAVVAREPAVKEALSQAVLTGVLLAADAGADIRRKISKTPVFSDLFTREEMGAALGRAPCAVLGLKANPLTMKLRQELARWHGVARRGITSTKANESCD